MVDIETITRILKDPSIWILWQKKEHPFIITLPENESDYGLWFADIDKDKIYAAALGTE